MTAVDWSLAGRVAGLGFLGVFVIMFVLVLVLLIQGKLLSKFPEKTGTANNQRKGE